MIYITAFLFVKDNKQDVFNAYENAVLPLLGNYNGNLIYRIKPDATDFINLEGEAPYEIHHISFKTNADFMGYIDDEERKRFENLKEESIKSTFIVKGEKI